jgi:DNA (cytosine-5)-methyltransferase 1
MGSKNGVLAISLFSGCGGLDLGSQMAGVPVISSLDFDEDCIKTLKLNKDFHKSKIFHKNINEISKNDYKELLNKYPKKKLIILGGPPCQPFSKAGYWVGNSKRKKEEDPRNMIKEYLRIISELKPDGFLFENVESILHPTNKKTIEKITSSIKKLKYKYRLIKALALDYGVPQKRRRVFIIASKNNFKSDEPKKTHCESKIAKDKGLLPYESVRKFILKFDKPEFFEKEEITENGTYGKDLKEVPLGGNYLDLTAKKGYANPKFIANTRFWSFLLKLDPDKPSWTIAAQPGPWVGPFHWKNRRLRAPEIAAIQTFPENYKFHGTRRSIQKQIGNAVPPLMGKVMVEFLKENL